jgi:hypothetical protein
MRFLGLHIENNIINAVLIEGSFGKCTSIKLYESPLILSHSIPQNVETFLEILPKKPDRIIIALQNNESSFRNLQIPSRDRNLIQNAVQFELDDELPLAIPDLILDWTILQQSKQQSLVHTAVTVRKTFATYVQSWDTIPNSPNIVTTNTWALRELLKKSQETIAPLLVVNCSAESLEFYVFFNHVPILSKSIFINAFEHSTQQQISDEYIVCLKDNVQQIQLSTKTITEHVLTEILFIGSLPNLEEFPDILEPVFDTPCRIWLPFKKLNPYFDFPTIQERQYVLATALAVCSLNINKKEILNFRKREFIKILSADSIHWIKYKKLLIMMLLIGFSLSLSTAGQYKILKTRLTYQQTKLEKILKKMLPNTSLKHIQSMLEDPTKLEKVIQTEKDKQKNLKVIKNQNLHTPLHTLHALSKSIPRELECELLQFKTGLSDQDPMLKFPHKLQHSFTFLIKNDPQAIERLAHTVINAFPNIQHSSVEAVTSLKNTPQAKVTFIGSTIIEDDHADSF